MYKQFSFSVNICDSLLQPITCQGGTLQGFGSSPIIFILFINDLIEYLRQECKTGILVSNTIKDILALLFADNVSCVSDYISLPTAVKLYPYILSNSRNVTKFSQN